MTGDISCSFSVDGAAANSRCAAKLLEQQSLFMPSFCPCSVCFKLLCMEEITAAVAFRLFTVTEAARRSLKPTDNEVLHNE